ncbi:hypothetical protein ES332_D10G290200v1 [Gossypium tomentosum]|uniref:Uncharacterized protein n=1 Tax=Gossypium tomentosum TaxID=34277 RepID=A0A5D2J9V7_GOSTO|nr:hypothetical protein ES332_D10G290200v1 [Gossypium tomentosum]
MTWQFWVLSRYGQSYSLVPVTLALLILFLISYANHGCRLKLRSSFSFSNPTCHELVAFDILVAQSSVAR